MAAFAPRVIAQKTKVVVVALAILAVAFVCQIIAIATPGWLRTHDVAIGLFLYCGSLTTFLRTRSTRDCKQMESLDIPEERWLIRESGEPPYGRCKVRIPGFLMERVVLVTMIAAILFGADTRSAMPRIGMMVTYDLSYSYIIYVLAGIMTVVGAVSTQRHADFVKEVNHAYFEAKLGDQRQAICTPKLAAELAQLEERKSMDSLHQ
ncbi:hypothetical protein PoB_002297700 [Plakobranchus ocellatus]|uniref:Uncharacterized protein n=1 Tax=Plakobranchus ocellatus TaxID=259542 RepID=A0AAV3ZPQ2_9GAST|nr:hypothetical protein PoB_002297700 [Plakobranchus ocellatus]